MRKSYGTGVPLFFICPVARRERVWPATEYPKGHDRIVRTGRTRKAPGRPPLRSLPESHEYVCECGHRGWSRHTGVLRYPLVEAA